MILGKPAKVRLLRKIRRLRVCHGDLKLRMRGWMKLGLWHRLGVVLSVVWVAGASTVIVLPRLVHASEASKSDRTACLSAKGEATRILRENPPVTGDRGRLTPSEFSELKQLTAEARRSAVQQLNRNCDNQYKETRDRVIHGLWTTLLREAGLPLFLAWLLTYLTLWAIRWILAGDEV